MPPPAQSTPLGIAVIAITAVVVGLTCNLALPAAASHPPSALLASGVALRPVPVVNHLDRRGPSSGDGGSLSWAALTAPSMTPQFPRPYAAAPLAATSAPFNPAPRFNLLPAALGTLAGLLASLAWRHRRAPADPTLTPLPVWTAASYSGAPSRRSTALRASGRDDNFDSALLKGSGWREDQSPLTTIDDIPPTDNSGFSQAGGFGWSSTSQGYDHITRRTQQRKEQQLMQMTQQQQQTKEAVVQEVKARRAARNVPTAADPPQVLLEYLLNTTTDDLAFEITRLRPFLNSDFDAHLETLTAEERAKEEAAAQGGEANAESATPPVTMLRNYEVLRLLINITFRNIDAAASYLTAPKDRLKKLLSAPDKKAMVREMAAANELDEELLTLLQTNEADARVSGATQVADFLGKLQAECRRFVTPS